MSDKTAETKTAETASETTNVTETATTETSKKKRYVVGAGIVATVAIIGAAWYFLRHTGTVEA